MVVGTGRKGEKQAVARFGWSGTWGWGGGGGLSLGWWEDDWN